MEEKGAQPAAADEDDELFGSDSGGRGKGEVKSNGDAGAEVDLGNSSC